MLPATAHTERPWLIHDVAAGFRLLDVWALPTPGGPEDFPQLVEQFRAGNLTRHPSLIVRTLFAIRWKLGEWLGWDDADTSVGTGSAPCGSGLDLICAWVPDPDAPGRYRGQMAVLVKPNGLGGRAYLAAIAPFRHFLVYPELLRGIGAAWSERTLPRVGVRRGAGELIAPIHRRMGTGLLRRAWLRSHSTR